MSSSVHLPLDIQAEIIRRIDDTRLLIRCRSISKEWKSFIDSPKFIADHSSAGQRQRHLLIHDEEYTSEEKYVSVVDNDSFPRDQYCLTPPSALSTAKPYNFIRSIGSSHGLLGYIVDENLMSIILWNPSIRRYVEIGNKVLHPRESVTHVGFGVCPGTSDPKLVKIDTLRSDPSDGGFMPWQVEVYALSSGVWGDPLCSTSCKLPRKSIILSWDRPPVVINGIIYWLASDQSVTGVDDGYDVIISFDLTTEEFEEIHLPDTLVNNYSLELANRRESLVVLEHCYNEETQIPVCGVWVMNHGGVPKSFTKLYPVEWPVLSDQYCSCGVLEFRKNGDPILGTTSHNYKYTRIEVSIIELYEPCSQCFIDLKFSREYPISVTSYTETLLLLDHRNMTN